MTVVEENEGEWFVVNDAGEQIAGPFYSEEDARAWIRRNRLRPT